MNTRNQQIHFCEVRSWTVVVVVEVRAWDSYTVRSCAAAYRLCSDGALLRQQL